MLFFPDQVHAQYSIGLAHANRDMLLHQMQPCCVLSRACCLHVMANKVQHSVTISLAKRVLTKRVLTRCTMVSDCN